MGNRSTFFLTYYSSIYTRCGGFMVNDFFMDLLDSAGELEFAATRCVHCGEVVDPVIQRNRRLGQGMMAARVSKRMEFVAGIAIVVLPMIEIGCV